MCQPFFGQSYRLQSSPSLFLLRIGRCGSRSRGVETTHSILLQKSRSAHFFAHVCSYPAILVPRRSYFSRACVCIDSPIVLVHLPYLQNDPDHATALRLDLPVSASVCPLSLCFCFFSWLQKMSGCGGQMRPLATPRTRWLHERAARPKVQGARPKPWRAAVLRRPLRPSQMGPRRARSIVSRPKSLLPWLTT